MEIKVKRRIISSEDARKEVDTLLCKLSDFDALRAHFLIEALLAAR